MKIPGGAKRKSTRVPRSDLKLVARREELDALLLAHDPKDAENAIQQVTDADHVLLRQIAREGAITGVSPRLRQNAIAVLGRFPTHDNVNFLAELAQHGEDFYVRSWHALVSLGNSGSALAGTDPPRRARSRGTARGVRRPSAASRRSPATSESTSSVQHSRARRARRSSRAVSS